MSNATGIDVGTRAVRILQGRMKGSAFIPTRFVSRARAEGESAADALRATIVEAKVKAARARLGLTGRDTILRYSQVPRLTDAQLRGLMKFEIDELAQQAGGNLASDFNLLPIPPGLTGDDTALVALARNEALDATAAAVAGTGVSVGSFTPNSIALYDAFLKIGSVGEDAVLIANVGEENTDVAIVMGPDLAFARNLSEGGNLFTQALAARFGAEDAEEIKRTQVNLAPQAKGRFKSAQEERATNAVLGAAGQFASLLQSTANLAKAQLKLPELRIARVLLCGGGARLLGLGEYLSAATGWQAQLFDPLESLDLGSLSGEERAALENERHEAVVALGLALASAEKGLYRLDILPESIVRKRRFAERTSFLIAAGVLAAGYLAVSAFTQRALAADARIIASAAIAEAKTRNDVHEKTLRLVGSSDGSVPGRIPQLADTATELELRAAVGPALVAVDRAMRKHLPADLWETKLDVKVDKDAAHPQLGATTLRRPVVHITGRGREGAERVDQNFQKFTSDLQAQFPAAGLVQVPRPKGKVFEFELFLNLLPVKG